jgi:hypothetical protein
MRVALPDTTEVPVGIMNQDLFAQRVARVESGIIVRHKAKRCCRLCDPVSGECRHLCVPKSSRTISR